MLLQTDAAIHLAAGPPLRIIPRLVTLVRQAYGLFQRVREAVHAGIPVRNSGA